jgi:hypothetical protein
MKSNVSHDLDEHISKHWLFTYLYATSTGKESPVSDGNSKQFFDWAGNVTNKKLLTKNKYVQTQHRGGSNVKWKRKKKLLSKLLSCSFRDRWLHYRRPAWRISLYIWLCKNAELLYVLKTKCNIVYITTRTMLSSHIVPIILTKTNQICGIRH